jgi:hypothetical protein
MSLRIAVSTSADRRLDHAAAVLGQWTGSEEIRILAPTLGAADDFVRERILSGGGGRRGLGRGTPLDAARQIAAPALARAGNIPVTGVAGEALVARAIQRSLNPGELPAGSAMEYFGTLARTAGFRRALARTIRELRMERIPLEEIRGLEPSGSDLWRLVAAYTEELESERLADVADVYQTATESIRSAAPAGTGAGSVLLIDTRPGSACERDFIHALVGAADSALAVLDPEDQEWIGNLAETFGTIVEVLDDLSSSKTLIQIRSFIFKSRRPEPGKTDSGFEFFSAADAGRESVEIARRMHAAAARGIRFDRMAVLLRNPETYQPLLSDALARAGIPAYFTEGTMRPNPAGRAFLALLATAAENLSAARFAEYLSLGQLPGRQPGAGLPDADSGSDTPLAVPAHWEKLLVEAAVIGGAGRWERRLDGMVAEIRRQIREAEVEDATWGEQLERRLDRVLVLRDFALPLIRQLDALPSDSTWREWLVPLRRLAVAALPEPEGVIEVLSELEPLGDIGPVGLGEVRRVLFDRLTFLRRDPGRRYGRVFIGAIAEAGGRAFDIVFLPGLAEGRFPQKALEDPLLLDRARARLPHRRLRRQDQRTAGERRLLHTALGAAIGQIFVSYPRVGLGGGRGQVPSFYALDLLRAAEGQVPELRELEQQATAAGLSRLGWPAPIEAVNAVDDAEYDLATIGEIMHPGAGAGAGQTDRPNAGRGHYLVTVNPCLARSLRTRARRWRNFWSAADGIYDPDPETRALLAQERPRARAYSATALERFAACPYRFLLASILRISPRDEIVSLDQIDPLTRGSLFHTVQFRLLTRLSDEGLVPVGPENLDRVRAIADEVLDGAAAEYHEELAPGVERVWTNDVEDLRTDLHGWLRIVAGESGATSAWTPTHFEYTFGLSGRGEADPASTAQEATIFGGVRLRGAIDLIETHPASGLLRIVDHKTGRAPASPPEATGGGRFLQPSLYALAAESLLGRQVATATLFHCTERGNFRRVEIHLDDSTRLAAESAIRLIDGSIGDGFLPAAPDKDACSRCDYRAVCGPYEETRTRRKHIRQGEPAEWIQRLRDLRGLP